MIESLIIQFGALGIVAYVVYSHNHDTKKLILNNTKALVSIEKTINKCEKK